MATNATRPLAVVTGASSGIGYELAKQFPSNGFDVVVAAEDAAIGHRAAGRAQAHRPQRARDHPPRQVRGQEHGRPRRRADPLHVVDRLDHAGAFQAVYNASKSYVQSLALALREELKDTCSSATRR